MRFINSVRGRAARPSHLVRTTRNALIVASAAAVLLVGTACSGSSQPAATPTRAATQAPPQAAAAAKQASQALKTDLAPLTTNVPLPLRKLDGGIAIAMTPFGTELAPVTIDRNAGTVTASIGAIAKPSVGVQMALGAPSIESLMSAFGGASIPIPTMPTTIPTMPPGIAPGATPPAGVPTPPPGFSMPPSGGIPSLPPGFTLPPGITIPGVP